MEKVLLKQIEVGFMENFSYFIGDSKAKEVALVDPGWEIPRLCSIAEENKYRIVAVLLTHGHFDHSQCVDELLSYYDVPVYISKYELKTDFIDCKNIHKTENGEKIEIGEVKVTCLHTPGHTQGCQCYLCGDILLTGDTLFIDGCGRCDLPGSDRKAMYHTLYDTIMKLPDSTIIYPGHNYGAVPFATLLAQKKTNPCFQARNMQDFLQYGI